MKKSILDIVICPDCGSHPLHLGRVRKRSGGEILDAVLTCEECQARFPVVEGVPYFVERANYTKTFGLEWNVFSRVQIDTAADKDSEKTFVDKTGWDPASLESKLILDAGCGAGRFTDVVSRGSSSVAGVDLSAAVHAAYKNCGARPNVHIIRADIFRLPFAPNTFDAAFSIGVLHHTPDPRAAFLNLPPLVRPGGRVAVWLYNTNDEDFIRRAELWRRLTTKIPPRLLLGLSILGVPLYHLYRSPVFQKIAADLKLDMPYIPMYPDWKERWLDTFDFYSPMYQDMRCSYNRVAEWFNEAGLDDIHFLPAETSVAAVAPDANPAGNAFLERISNMRSSLSGRELILYGTGAAGRAAYREFQKLGARITAFAQTDPEAGNPTCLGLPVLTPEQLKDKDQTALVAICSGPGLRPITETLNSLGLEEWKDFFFYAYLL